MAIGPIYLDGSALWAIVSMAATTPAIHAALHALVHAKRHVTHQPIAPVRASNPRTGLNWTDIYTRRAG